MVELKFLLDENKLQLIFASPAEKIKDLNTINEISKPNNTPKQKRYASDSFHVSIFVSSLLSLDTKFAPSFWELHP